MIIYEEILRLFQEKKIKYILVGGIAVNLLGSMRSTADMDILVEMSDENLREIVTIFKDLGYHVKQPVDPMGIAVQEIREDWIINKHMKAFNFYKEDELSEVDIIIESPVSYEEAEKDTVAIKIDDLILPVISIDKLIKMKRDTGRTIDKLDIEELTRIQNINEEI